jgi:hypothetical protein
MKVVYNGERIRRFYIKTPQGNAMPVTQLVRQGMFLNDKNPAKTATIIGLSLEVFRFIRKLLILKDSNVLNEEELKMVNEALYEIDNRHTIGKYRKQLYELIKLHWKHRTMNGSSKEQKRIEEKSRHQFDKALFIIRETCTNNEEMNLPKLTTAERMDAIAMLGESVAGLSLLIAKIQKEGHHG